jgi:hypothetical protein
MSKKILCISNNPSILVNQLITAFKIQKSEEEITVVNDTGQYLKPVEETLEVANINMYDIEEKNEYLHKNFFLEFNKEYLFLIEELNSFKDFLNKIEENLKIDVNEFFALNRIDKIVFEFEERKDIFDFLEFIKKIAYLSDLVNASQIFFILKTNDKIIINNLENIENELEEKFNEQLEKLAIQERIFNVESYKKAIMEKNLSKYKENIIFKHINEDSETLKEEYKQLIQAFNNNGIDKNKKAEIRDNILEILKKIQNINELNNHIFILREDFKRFNKFLQEG